MLGKKFLFLQVCVNEVFMQYEVTRVGWLLDYKLALRVITKNNIETDYATHE